MMEPVPNVIDEPRAAAPGEDREQVPELTARTKVLLIEDNPGDAQLIQIMLADAGSDFFVLETVERLQQGLGRVRRGDCGVVLLDLSLPDSQGLETFSQLHAQAPGIPIIVLSGLNDTTV